MSEIRELLARAQDAELLGDRPRAATLLREAAAWYRDRQQLRRAAQMLRQARRAEGLDDDAADSEAGVVELPETEPAAPLPLRPVVDDAPDPFGFGDDFGEVAINAGRRVLVEQREPRLATPGTDAWCSFCCRPTAEVGALVAGPAGAFICNGCTSISHTLQGGAALAPVTEVKLRALEHELPAQQRARARFLRQRGRVALVIGPAGAGKSAFANSLAHADHRVIEVTSPVDERAVLGWLDLESGRSVSLVVTAPVPTPALVLEGELGPEPLHDTATLIAALPQVPRGLVHRIDLVHAFEAPDEAALTALAGHLASKRGISLPVEVIRRVVQVALTAQTGAHELVTLLGRIPPGTYRA